jgi:replicative DNA helicase
VPVKDQPKAPPHNLDAEQALLGAILLANEAIDRVEFLEPSHFFELGHRRIFESCRTIIASGRTVTVPTLQTYMPDDFAVGQVRAHDYLNNLAGEGTTIANAAEYGKIVYDLAVKRALITLGETLINESLDPKSGLKPDEQIEQAESRLYKIAESGRFDRGFVSFEQATAQTMVMAGNAFQRGGGLSGLPTHLADVDRVMGGLQKSDLIILAGRPGMGKTALGTTIAFNVAERAGEPGNGGVVGFFSLEMSAEQLATRVLADRSEVPSNNIRRGAFGEDEFHRIKDSALKFRSIPLHIDEAGGLSLPQLVARARRLKRQRGLDLVVIDYLQLMRGSNRKNDNRVNEVTEITTGLKSMAKELDVPVLALSQLSRQVESRDDKRPQLSDLRESGSIEQDADVVMFLYREEYYLDMKGPPKEGGEEHHKWLAAKDAAHNVADLIIGKHRHGPTDTVKLHFDPRLTRFANLTKYEG